MKLVSILGCDAVPILMMGAKVRPKRRQLSTKVRGLHIPGDGNPHVRSSQNLCNCDYCFWTPVKLPVPVRRWNILRTYLVAMCGEVASLYRPCFADRSVAGCPCNIVTPSAQTHRRLNLSFMFNFGHRQQATFRWNDPTNLKFLSVQYLSLFPQHLDFHAV
jgi:hypothetical protein